MNRAELEWKIVYVGSAEDEKHDQTLDSVLVGPVQLGCNKFVFQVKPSCFDISRECALAISYPKTFRLCPLI